MKYREILVDELKPLPYFDKDRVYRLSEQYNLKKTTVDTYISRSLVRKDFIQLKKGTYVSTDFYERNRSEDSYHFYLANVLRSPSYVSSWAALQYYNLTTEVVHDVTSVTPKITRSYHTKIGNFTYRSLREELFLGFTLMKGKFDFFIATPPKALFDLLYFKTNQFRSIRADQVMDTIEELRIDFDEMEKKDQNAFARMIHNFFERYG